MSSYFTDENGLQESFFINSGDLFLLCYEPHTLKIFIEFGIGFWKLADAGKEQSETLTKFKWAFSTSLSAITNSLTDLSERHIFFLTQPSIHF